MARYTVVVARDTVTAAFTWRYRPAGHFHRELAAGLELLLNEASWEIVEAERTKERRRQRATEIAHMVRFPRFHCFGFSIEFIFVDKVRRFDDPAQRGLPLLYPDPPTLHKTLRLGLRVDSAFSHEPAIRRLACAQGLKFDPDGGIGCRPRWSADSYSYALPRLLCYILSKLLAVDEVVYYYLSSPDAWESNKDLFVLLFTLRSVATLPLVTKDFPLLHGRKIIKCFRMKIPTGRKRGLL